MTDVVLDGTKLALGTSGGLEVTVSAATTDVVFSATVLELRLVVSGVDEVVLLLLLLELVVEVEVEAGRGVCETSPPVTL